MGFMDDDMAAMLDSDLGTISVIYTHGTDAPKTIRAVYVPAEQGNKMQTIEIENVKPYLKCATVDVPTLRHGDSFAISSTTWYCCDMTVDGIGMTKIDISKDKYVAR